MVAAAIAREERQMRTLAWATANIVNPHLKKPVTIDELLGLKPSSDEGRLHLDTQDGMAAAADYLSRPLNKRRTDAEREEDNGHNPGQG